MNDLHNRPDAVRYRSLKKKSSVEIYLYTVFGEEEVYTSTFNGVFDRLLVKLKEKRQSGYDLLKSIKFFEFRTFLKMCISYGRLDDFLKTFDNEKQKRSIIKRFITNIDKSQNKVDQFMAVAEGLAFLRSANVSPLLKSVLLSEYDRVKNSGDTQSQTLYGLLITTFVKTNKISDDPMLLEIVKKHPITTISSFDPATMYTSDPETPKQLIQVQKHLFYDDSDAIASYHNFLRQYRKKKNWRVSKKNGYVIIEGKRANRTIRIYANKPAKEDEVLAANVANMNTAIGKQSISMLVHRGHSYHADKSIPSITESSKLVFLGSCGGYNNVGAVLDKSESAHIISTRGTGMKAINDPLIFAINQQILAGKPFEWSPMWSQHAERYKNSPIKKDWEEYVAPHENYALMYLQAYRRLS